MEKRAAQNIFCLFALIFILFTDIHGQTINNARVEINFTDSAESRKLQSDSRLKHSHTDGILPDTGDSVTTIQSAVIPIPLEEFGSFVAVAITINHSTHTGEFIVDFRGSADSLTWGEWETINHLHAIEKVAEEFRSDLFFMDETTRYFQFQLAIEKIDGHFPSIHDVSLFFTSPLDDNKKKTKIHSPIPVEKGVNTPDSLERPPYVSREGWGCPQDENTTERQLTTVTHLIIHHSAGQTNSENFPAVVLAYWDFHVNFNGWADIGYNWLIDRNGVIYKGRAWYDEFQENVIGAHNSGRNSGTSGICLIGDFTGGALPTAKMWDATFVKLAFLCYKFGLDPLAYTYHASIERDNDVISGHRHSGGGTVCPGDIADYYDAIRQVVAGKLLGLAPSVPLNMDIHIHDCPVNQVSFLWMNYGTGWQIHVSTDPNFDTYYIKWVSDLTSYTGPQGFVLAPFELDPLDEFQEGEIYYWRIRYDDKYSADHSFMMRSCSATSIDDGHEMSAISIYPNPSTGNFIVSLGNENGQGFYLEILNTVGTRVYSAISGTNDYRVNTSSMPAGLYIINIKGEGFVERRKILIE